MLTPVSQMTVGTLANGKLDLRAGYPAQVLIVAVGTIAQNGWTVQVTSEWAVCESEDGKREAMLVLTGPLLLVVLSTIDRDVAACYRLHITRKSQLKKAARFVVRLIERHLKGDRQDD